MLENKVENKNIISDKLGEECGIFGGYCKSADIAPYIKKGLFKLQHRGQESAGICTGNSTQTLYKDRGLVVEVFDEVVMQKLTGQFGIGHVRYSTQGESNALNAQPYLAECLGGQISIAHNGNIKNAAQIREELEKSGEIFITKSDSEVSLKKIINEIENIQKDLVYLNLPLTPALYPKGRGGSLTFGEVGDCLNKYFSEGAYSVVFYLPNKILAYRDALGYRPLFFCEAENGYFIASEDVAFNELNVVKIVEIQAGWGVEITDKGYEIKPYADKLNEKNLCQCVFEHIYFSHPDSNTFGSSVYKSRLELGKLLAQNDNKNVMLNCFTPEHPDFYGSSFAKNSSQHRIGERPCDPEINSGRRTLISAPYNIVIPIMGSGFVAAKGYSQESGIPFEIGLLTNSEAGRSFIEPTQELRENKVKEKFFAIKSVVEGKSVILVDDSIVRGTTAKETVKMLKDSGAKEVHFRLASPMIVNTCSWGVDIPTREELITHKYKTEEQIAEQIGADSVKYLPFEILKEHFEKFGQSAWCYNCLMTNIEYNCLMAKSKNDEKMGEIGCKQLTKTAALT